MSKKTNEIKVSEYESPLGSVSLGDLTLAEALSLPSENEAGTTSELSSKMEKRWKRMALHVIAYRNCIF